MNKALAFPTNTKVWRNKTPGIAEFGALLNQIPEACLLFDRGHDVVLMANSSFLKLAAYSAGEISGKSIADFLPELSADQISHGVEVNAFLNRREREPLPVMAIPRFLDPSGGWLLITLLPKNEIKQDANLLEDRVFQSLLELADSAEETTLESYLSKSLEIIRSLFETDLVCIYQADTEMPILRKVCSTEEDQVFPGIIPSSDLIRLSTPNHWIPGKRVITDLQRAGRVSNLAYVTTTPLGQHGALFGLLVVGDQNKAFNIHFFNLLEVIGAFITSVWQHFILVDNIHKQTEKQARALVHYDNLLDYSREGILAINPDLRVAKMNPAAELMLGYSDKEVCGQPVDNVLIGPDGLLPALESACRGIPTHDLGNVSLHRRTGQSFPARIQTIPVQKGGAVISVLVFINDMSEDEQIRVRTQQLEHRAVIGEFTAIFAHEVRNPINNISTGLQLLASRLANDDPNQNVISRIQTDCSRLDHLMESILSFSRPMEPKLERVELSVLLQRILDRWRPRFARVNVKPFFQATENTPPVYGDPKALEQVFTNLFSNAVEAMSKTGGTLAIKMGPDNSISNRPQVEVSVSDNGPGIPDDIKDRIFEPFVTTNSRGTGLGLAITKRIITAHQGNIKLNTFAGGTVFCVYLPAFRGE